LWIILQRENCEFLSGLKIFINIFKPDKVYKILVTILLSLTDSFTTLQIHLISPGFNFATAYQNMVGFNFATQCKKDRWISNWNNFASSGQNLIWIGLCKVFTNSLPSIYQFFTKSWPNFCLIFTKSLPSLSQVFTKFLASLHQVFPKFFPSLYQVFTKSLPSLY
jgi:hypothetical protein